MLSYTLYLGLSRPTLIRDHTNVLRKKKFLMKESICESSLILNSSSVLKAAVKDLMITQGVYDFSSFSAIIYWRVKFITKCSETEK